MDKFFQIEEHEILSDLNARLKFKKITKLSIPDDISKAGWEEMLVTRREVFRALEDLLTKAAKAKKDLTDDEDEAYRFGDAFTSRIADELTFREINNTKDPIDLTVPINPLHQSGRYVAHPDTRRIELINNPDLRSYRGMFGENLSDGGFGHGVEGLREFFRVALSGKYDPRLAEDKRSQFEGSGPLGGYAIPPALASILVDMSIQDEIVRPLATVYPMTSKTLDIPAWQASSHTSGNMFGGFQLQYLAEGGTATIQTAKMRMMELNAHKAGLYSNMSREIMDDLPVFQTWLQNAMKKALAAGQDYNFLNANGVGKPLGVLQSPSRIIVSRAAANQIAISDLDDMWGRLHPSFASNAVWLISTTAVPQMMGLADSAGNRLWNPGYSGSAANAVPTTLYGRPTIVTERTPSLGSEGDICLVDLSQYGVGLRGDIRIEMTNAANWLQDLVDIRVLIRHDGQSLWDKAITPENGGDTLSWCVVLG